jgi:hypothetical protein
MPAKVNEQKKPVTRTVVRRKRLTPPEVIRRFFGDHFVPTGKRELQRLEKAIYKLDHRALCLSDAYYLHYLAKDIVAFQKGIEILVKATNKGKFLLPAC